MFDLESDIGQFEVTGWGSFLMESVCTWCQIQFFRLTSFSCPVFYCISFSFLALVDLNLSTCDFFSTKANLTEGNLTWKIVVFVCYCNSWTIRYNTVVFTLRVFLSNIRHFHCTVSFDLESDVSHLEVTCWSCFLMEGVSTWCQVQFFRLTSFRCPAFYCLAFCLVALVDLDLSTCDFCTTKVNFTESNGFWTVIVFIRYCNSWAVGYDLVVFTLRVFFSNIRHFHCTVSFDLESDVSHLEVTCWSCFLMESVSAWSQVQFFRLTSFRCPAFYWIAFCLIALEDLDLSTCDFSSTKINFTESNSFWTVIVFIGYS